MKPFLTLWAVVILCSSLQGAVAEGENLLIFRAGSPTQVVAFHDEKAVPGEELVINFIQLKPYLER